MTPLDIPGPHAGPHGGTDGGAWLPLLGFSTFLVVLVLLAALAAYLWRSGHLARWLAAVRPSPEQDAKRVLADRFATGDLSPEEFLERASILNWTPGSEAYPVRTRRRLRR